MSCSSSTTEVGYYQYDYNDCDYNEYNDCPMMPMNSPVYTYMRQPVQVYYAQMPPHRRRSDKKGNPNCFVKAFRWYTKEHVPPKHETMTDANVAGFATWLDNKYQQYLRENEGHDQLAQTSLRASEDNNSSDACRCRSCSLQPKKKKLKSLRKRHFHSPNKKHTEDETNENQSTVYIMPPQNLSCPASECCHLNRTSNVSEKKIVKSQSEVNCRATKPIDLAKTQEDLEINRTSKQTIDIKDKVLDETSNQNDNKSCQCSAAKVAKMDVGTQYETSNVSWVSSNCSGAATCCTCDVTATGPKSRQNSQFGMKKRRTGWKSISKKSSKELSSKSNNESTSCQCFSNAANDAQTQYSYCTYCKCPAYHENSTLVCYNKSNRSTCESPSLHQEMIVASPVVIRKCSLNCPAKTLPQTQSPAPITETVETKISRTYTTNTNNASQTSDHPISLEVDTIHKYPLFMRIVCADRPCDECTHKTP